VPLARAIASSSPSKRRHREHGPKHFVLGNAALLLDIGDNRDGQEIAVGKIIAEARARRLTRRPPSFFTAVSTIPRMRVSAGFRNDGADDCRLVEWIANFDVRKPMAPSRAKVLIIDRALDQQARAVHAALAIGADCHRRGPGRACLLQSPRRRIR